MAKKAEQFRTQVKGEVQDQAGKLVDTDVDACVLAAVLDRYSSDRPQVVVTDVVADGTPDLPLPAPGGNDAPLYEDGFSIVQQIEYPIGQVPESLFFENDWNYYRSPAGVKLRLIGESGGLTPNVNDAVRVTWTARHAADFSTVPDRDFYPICAFASSLAFEKLAAIYAQTGDPTVSADVVNYRTKSQEYLAMAKTARQRYFNALGIDESKDSGMDRGPAIAHGVMTEILQGGVPRLIRTKYNR